MSLWVFCVSEADLLVYVDIFVFVVTDSSGSSVRH